MQRYDMGDEITPPYPHSEGDWVKWDDAAEMGAALKYIIEQADSLEDARATAKEVLSIVDGRG